MYSVIEGTRLVVHTSSLERAARHSVGIAGRTLIEHTPNGKQFELIAFGGKGRFSIYGEVLLDDGIQVHH